jgi:hypothetical protein
MYERVRTGIHAVRTVASIFPYLNLERKSEADRSLDVVQTEIHVVRTNDAWSVGRPDGMACRPDGWNCGQMSVWTGWHVVQTGWHVAWMVVREPIFLNLHTVQKLWNTSE